MDPGNQWRHFHKHKSSKIAGLTTGTAENMLLRISNKENCQHWNVQFGGASYCTIPIHNSTEAIQGATIHLEIYPQLQTEERYCYSIQSRARRGAIESKEIGTMR